MDEMVEIFRNPGKEVRINGKVNKRYEIDTPLNRVLRLKDIEVDMRNRIDLVKLTKAIVYLKEKLEQTYQTKRGKEKCVAEI